MSAALSFKLRTAAGASPIDVPISGLVIAGRTGRDEQALEKHIRELEALGVTRPKTTPIFYRGHHPGQTNVRISFPLWAAQGEDGGGRRRLTPSITKS